MSTFHSVSAAGSDLIGSCLTTTALPLQMKTLMRKAKSLPAHVVSRKHRRKQISLGFCNEKTEGEKLITSCFFLNLDKKKNCGYYFFLSFSVLPWSPTAIDFLWFVKTPERCCGRDLIYRPLVQSARHGAAFAGLHSHAFCVFA